MLNQNKNGTFDSVLNLSPKIMRLTLIIFVLVVGVTLSLMRYSVKDETGFLIEAATMSDCMLEGRWFGNEAVGWHGFIFKIPAAILFTIFGRSIFIATLTNVIFGALTCWLCFGILRKLLKSTEWAFACTWLVITTFHFVLSLPTFLRDIPVMFAVLLLISAIINKRNKWLIGLCMMLILDAKEGVFFAFAPGFCMWVVLSELCSRWESEKEQKWETTPPCGHPSSTSRAVSRQSEDKTISEQVESETISQGQSPAHSTKYSEVALKSKIRNPKSKIKKPFTSFARMFERLFAGFFPATVFLVLMFFTSVVPLNMLTATVFGVTSSGMHDMKFNFSSKRAIRSVRKYVRSKNDSVKSKRLKPNKVKDSMGKGSEVGEEFAVRGPKSEVGNLIIEDVKLGGSEVEEEFAVRDPQSEISNLITGEGAVGSKQLAVSSKKTEVGEESAVRGPKSENRNLITEDVKLGGCEVGEKFAVRDSKTEISNLIEDVKLGGSEVGEEFATRDPKSENRNLIEDVKLGGFEVGEKFAVRDSKTEISNLIEDVKLGGCEVGEKFAVRGPKSEVGNLIEDVKLGGSEVEEEFAVRDSKTEVGNLIEDVKLGGCEVEEEFAVRDPQSEISNLITGVGAVCSKQLAVSSKKSEVGEGAVGSQPKTAGELAVGNQHTNLTASQRRSLRRSRRSKRKTGSRKRSKSRSRHKRPSVFGAYIKKLLFPRTFSFIAMPKIIVIPAFFMSFVMLRRFWNRGKTELIALPLLLWSYLIIYLLRESHGRYLMPVLPLLALFFAFFMIDGLKRRWFPVIVLTICALMIGFGFMFEIKFVAVKIGFNIILFSFAVLALIGYRKKWKYAKLFALAVPLFTGLFATGTALAGSLTLGDGQMRSFFRFGDNMQAEKVLAEFEEENKFWLNGFASGYVMQFYMNERLTAGERVWRLAKWVPKKNLLRRYGGNQHRRIGIKIRSMDRFRKKIMTNNVTKVGLVISTYPKQKFSYHDKLDDFNKAEWLEFERMVELKNKELHIFGVVSE